MKHISLKTFIQRAVIILLAVWLLLIAPAFGQYEISWYTIDGGGGSSSGGPYTLVGTIGQPDAAWSSGAVWSSTIQRLPIRQHHQDPRAVWTL